MNRIHVLSLPGVGPLRIVKNRRARRLSIQLRPFEGIRVVVPRGMSMAAAECAVRGRAAWILRQSARVRLREAARTALGPPTAELDRERARIILTTRIRELALRYDFEFDRISIRRQRSRWGSCSARNHISLNIQLILLPERLRDYVLLHELVHTRVKHHGPLFWEELKQVAPDARGLRTELAGIALQPP